MRGRAPRFSYSSAHSPLFIPPSFFFSLTLLFFLTFHRGTFAPRRISRRRRDSSTSSGFRIRVWEWRVIGGAITFTFHSWAWHSTCMMVYLHEYARIHRNVSANRKRKINWGSEMRMRRSTRLVIHTCYILNANRDTAKRNRNCIYVRECETEVWCEIEIGRVIFIAIEISNAYRRSRLLARTNERENAANRDKFGSKRSYRLPHCHDYFHYGITTRSILIYGFPLYGEA